MKRHASLIPLSREHHDALLLARFLQKTTPPYKGFPTELPEKARYALNFYNEKLTEHFRQEEAIIPIVKGESAALDALMDEMVNEHIILRELFIQLNDHTELLLPLDHLGKTLEDHIRKEERQIFPLIQENCSHEKLERIRVLVAEH